MAVVKVSRFDIILVSLDPTQGAEISKTRPCVIVSPDEMNRSLKTIIIAPMTTKIRDYPMRVYVEFGSQAGEIALDQIRTLDKLRIIKKIGTLDSGTSVEVLDVLSQMFS